MARYYRVDFKGKGFEGKEWPAFSEAMIPRMGEIILSADATAGEVKGVHYHEERLGEDRTTVVTIFLK